jgi:SAM-dependent methyltransferase
MTEWYVEVLACPECASSLAQRKGLLVCGACGFKAEYVRNADLRPRQQRGVSLDVRLLFDPEQELGKVEMGRPTVSYRGPLGKRDATELLSLLQQTLEKPGRVLDLGCGPRDQADSIGYLGHQYVGIDLSSTEADLRADAHALPFQSSSFDFVFSYAVLEHLHNPFVALREIKRVLKPGAIFVGTVSQGEPFHNSFFHHTVWGVLSVVHATGMELIRLWPCWDTLSGLAEMGRYPRVLRYAIRAIDWIHRRFLFLAPRKMRWSSDEKLVDELHRAASLGFVIRKRHAQ